MWMLKEVTKILHCKIYTLGSFFLIISRVLKGICWRRSIHWWLHLFYCKTRIVLSDYNFWDCKWILLCDISLLAVRQVEMLEVILKNLQVVVVDLC